jgi:hypothetical protein
VGNSRNKSKKKKIIGGKNNTSRENRMRLKKMSYAKRSTHWRCRLPAISVRRDVIIASSLEQKTYHRNLKFRTQNSFPARLLRCLSCMEVCCAVTLCRSQPIAVQREGKRKNAHRHCAADHAANTFRAIIFPQSSVRLLLIVYVHASALI